MQKSWCFWTVVLKTLEGPLDCEEIQPVHSKGDQSWVFIGRTEVQAETPILWPPHAKSWFIWKERLREEGEGDDRWWDGWMASPTQWTWVWVSSGSWWWTGRPGMLRFMGSQRVGHNWATELTKMVQKQTCLRIIISYILFIHSGSSLWTIFTVYCFSYQVRTQCVELPKMLGPGGLWPYPLTSRSSRSYTTINKLR